ncbi:MAG: FliH/SctL family protein [Syntrophomonadaceae bacterium]|nr:FliH/SctL family protein [Syntrophomonadaceae bacterium]MDD3888801.1 FliH/SctL family protein [Syntrophomonadaceae bacterium]MDD4548224.1 FliH/SctL family protein [Syntrophomonadaceae bacterium]
MSRVIKKSELLSSPPRIINCNVYEEIEPDLVEKEAVNLYEHEKEELEKVKIETKGILSETEQMVMELLQKARDEARNIINTAHEEADTIKTQVYEEAGQIRKDAEIKGYNEGLEQAEQEMAELKQRSREESKQIIEEARTIKIDMFKTSEQDMVCLAMAIARKVVAEELSINPDVILNVLKEAVTHIDQPGNLTLYVNPAEIDKILQLIKLEKFSDIGNKDALVEVLADSRISPGGCIVESEVGSVDSRIETRIEGIDKAIQEVTPDD